MCGILGYLSSNEKIKISNFTSMLYKLKHRGEDSCGISFLYNNKFETIKKNTFEELNNEVNQQTELYHSSILGHVRYTTSSKESPIIQPCNSINSISSYSFIFNGNIPTYLYDDYKEYTSDTNLIIDFFNKNTNNHVMWETLLEEFMKTFRRSYSLILQTNEGFYVLRDQIGVRPLYYLKLDKSYIFTSESCIFDKNDLKNNKLVEVKSGEIISIKNGLIVKGRINQSKFNESHCLFEYIYFLKKESSFENISVREYRYTVGEKMGVLDRKYFDNTQKKQPIVIGIPNTGNDYAVSYANSVELELKEYILKNKNVGRTFILKNSEERKKISKQKYIFDNRIKGENIILVDDSLVRGLTMKILVNQLKTFGVGDIHVRIMSPPIISPCKYGIDIPTKEELIYNSYSGENELSNYIGCDSIKYFNLNEHKKIVSNYEKKCIDCFSPNPKYEW